MTANPGEPKPGLRRLTWRNLALAFVKFGGLGLLLLLGAPLLGLNGQQTVQLWLVDAARGPWGLPVVIMAFAALAFVGVPQFVLIGAAVFAFGPWLGFAYSWLGTLISAWLTFWVGRMFGARVMASVRSEGVSRFMAMVGDNGFFVSLLVRQVPTAPFIIVNMAAGITPMRQIDFLAGTAIGIIPKVALTAFAGASLLLALRGGGLIHYVALVGIAILWIGIGWLARGWLKRRQRPAMVAAVHNPSKDPSVQATSGHNDDRA